LPNKIPFILSFVVFLFCLRYPKTSYWRDWPTVPQRPNLFCQFVNFLQIELYWSSQTCSLCGVCDCCQAVTTELNSSSKCSVTCSTASNICCLTLDRKVSHPALLHNCTLRLIEPPCLELTVGPGSMNSTLIALPLGILCAVVCPLD
jgi:hypothetical protein